MTKKMVSFALLGALLLALASCCAYGESQVDAALIEPIVGDRYFDDPISGIKFLWPDAWYTALYDEPCLLPYGTDHGFGLDYISTAGLEAMNKLYSDPNLPDDCDAYTPEQKELEDILKKNILPLCAFIIEKDDKKDEDMRSRYPVEKVLGEKDGTVYTLLTNPNTDLSILTEEEKAEYQALLVATVEFGKDMTLSGMKDMFESGAVVFDGQCLNGEKIDSSCFNDYKLTMINIWATWCGPCVAELPELQKLYANLPEGVNLLGICTDGEDEAELARRMQDEIGVKYQNIAANKEMQEGFLANVQGFPTTIFVDGAGNIVGEPFIGVPSGDVVEGYRSAIEERLALLEQ